MEAGDALEEMLDAMRRGMDPDVNLPQDQIEATLEKFQKGSFLEDMGMDGKDFTIDYDGTKTPAEVTFKYKGIDLDMDKVQENLRNGDLIGAMKDMGFPDDTFTDEVKAENAKYKAEFNNSPFKKMLNSLDNLSKSSADMRKGLGPDPTTPDQLQKLVDDNAKMKKQMEDLQKQVKDSKGDVEKTSKWDPTKKLALAALAAGLATGLYFLFEAVSKHACEMSGCWLVDKSTGNKCKISNMSCNDESDDSACGCGGNFKSLCPGSCLKFVENCTPANPDNPGGPCAPTSKACDPTTNSCCTNMGTIPASCSGGKCGLSGDSGNCSPNCSCSVVQCPSGYTLQCVNASFFDAWNDFGLPNPFGDVSSIFSKIIKIVIYIIVAVLVVVVIFYVIKFAFGMISGHEKE